MSPNAGIGGGGELRGLSQWVQLYTGAHINFGDLTLYLTYASTHKMLKISSLITSRLGFKYRRWWGNYWLLYLFYYLYLLLLLLFFCFYSQAEAAAYCRSNGLSPISLDDPAKEREFASKFTYFYFDIRSRSSNLRREICQIHYTVPVNKINPLTSVA